MVKHARMLLSTDKRHYEWSFYSWKVTHFVTNYYFDHGKSREAYHLLNSEVEDKLTPSYGVEEMMRFYLLKQRALGDLYKKASSEEERRERLQEMEEYVLKSKNILEELDKAQASLVNILLSIAYVHTYKKDFEEVDRHVQ